MTDETDPRFVAPAEPSSGPAISTGALTHARPQLRIQALQGGRGLSRFIDVPWWIYAGDPMWVPPLALERRLHLAKNPFLDHARVRFWVATRNGRPVGRISAQVDDLHLERYDDATGHFGFLEAVDDEETFTALFESAEGWLREQGMRRVVGPFSFSINDEVGVLVDGFDTPPMFMMPHGRPYYDARIRQAGYEKAKDLQAYILDPTGTPPTVMQASLRKAAAWKMTVRPVDMSDLKNELVILRDIFNDAWSENWNFVPFTAGELDTLGQSLRLFVPKGYVQIVEVAGDPAAMIVVLPNLNEILRDLDGRLFPAGWLRLLWRLRAPTATARVPLMGVRKKYQRSAIGIASLFLLLAGLKQPMLSRGVNRVELSWVLEDNRPMRHIMERLGAEPYKTYRMYQKNLS